ncbi:hypothetical protein BU23DRAFT_575648 [Bimuria novae-zelandiae CBS 107.79]|uniref:Rhodopsin domain-containing protein n=1 Tax=Bimuria novae-zelandiae CBS 107.79 TaxID=1447943 RepID=A0A6A5UI68_9PLEO|nr:hypothetical protein BU23DRAFT_575648 [Bimuria novae-zelandiae CBS 107.79]
MMRQSRNSEDEGPVIARVGIAVYVVAVFFVALRFLTRGWLVRRYGLDDLFIGLALLFGAGETVTLLFQVKHGRGRHSDQVAVGDLNKMIMYKYIGLLLYYVANWAVKMSILILYHRIYSLQKALPWYLRREVVWAMAAAVTASTLSFFLVESFGCVPVSAIFDLDNTEKRCIARGVFHFAQAGINCFTDLVLVVFPLPLLGLLKISRRQRYLLVLIFSIGFLPLVATTIRLCHLVMAVRSTVKPHPYGDPSWKRRWIPLWSQIEIDVGIVAASLPSLNPLLKQMWSGFAHTGSILPSRIPSLIESGTRNLGRDAPSFQKLPSIISSLPKRSVSTLGELDHGKRLTWYDDARNSEDREDGCKIFPGPFDTTQMGVARTVDTQLSRAAFVDVPSSPRRDGFLVPSEPNGAC